MGTSPAGATAYRCVPEAIGSASKPAGARAIRSGAARRSRSLFCRPDSAANPALAPSRWMMHPPTVLRPRSKGPQSQLTVRVSCSCRGGAGRPADHRISEATAAVANSGSASLSTFRSTRTDRSACVARTTRKSARLRSNSRRACPDAWARAARTARSRRPANCSRSRTRRKRRSRFEGSSIQATFRVRRVAVSRSRGISSKGRTIRQAARFAHCGHRGDPTQPRIARDIGK